MKQPSQSSFDETDFISFYDVLAFLWKWRFVFAAGIGLGLVGGVVAWKLQTPGYSSELIIPVASPEVEVSQDPVILNKILAGALSRPEPVKKLVDETLANLKDRPDLIQALATTLKCAVKDLPLSLTLHIQSVSTAALIMASVPKDRFFFYFDFLDAKKNRILVSMPEPGSGGPILLALGAAFANFVTDYQASEIIKHSKDRVLLQDVQKVSDESYSKILLEHTFTQAQFDYQKDVQKLISDLYTMDTELTALVPQAKLAPHMEPLFLNFDSTSLLRIEVQSMRRRLASAKSSLPFKAYDRFSDELSRLALIQGTLAASDAKFGADQLMARTMVLTAAYSLPLPSSDAVQTLPSKIDIYEGRSTNFWLLGIVVGLFSATFIATGLQVGPQILAEVKKRKLA